MAGGRIKGITIEIGGETTKLEKALKSVYDKGRDLTREMKEVNRALKFNPKNVELTAQKQSILKEQVENTRKRLDELKSSQEQVNEQYRKGEIGEEQYRAFQREIIETESILKSYEKQLSEVSDKHKLIGKSMEEFGGKMQKVGGKMQDVGKSLTMKITTPLVAMGGIAFKAGMEFESAMSEVGAVSGATAEEMKLLEESAREVGKTTNKSATEAAEALTLLGMAGWDVEESQAALLPLVKLSSAGNIEMSRAADLMTNSMATMGIEIEDVDRYLDVLANTSTMTNTDIDGLGEAFITVGGRLKGLGVDFEEGAAALAVLAKNGIEGSEAGNGLNAVLANLTAPTGRAKKALEELGVSAFDSNGEFIGIEETLQLVEDAMAGMDAEQQNMYLSMIGGKEHMSTLSALMGGLEGDFDNFNQGIQSSDGALNDMYGTMTDNVQGSLDILKSSLSDVSIEFFKMTEGPIRDLIDKLAQAVDWFGSLDGGTQQAIVMAGGFAAALGPVIMVLGSTTKNLGYLIEGGGKLIGNWDKIKGAGSLLAGGLKSTVGFLFSPAGMILVGIAAVIAGGVWLYKNWDTVKEKGAQLKNSVSQSWESLRSATVTKFNQIKDGIMNPINRAKDAVKAAVDKMKSFFNFNWKLPKIKMPRFSVSGSANPLNWLKEGVPKLSVSWHAKGGILTRPGVFGMMGNQLLAGGEHRTGGEAILPLNRLSGLMADAMEMVNGRNTSPEVVVNVDTSEFNRMLESHMRSNTQRPIYLQVDGKTFAKILEGEITDQTMMKVHKAERGLA